MITRRLDIGPNSSPGGDIITRVQTTHEITTIATTISREIIELGIGPSKTNQILTDIHTSFFTSDVAVAETKLFNELLPTTTQAPPSAQSSPVSQALGTGQSSTSRPHSGFPASAIAGAVLGLAVILALCAGAVFLLRRRRRRAYNDRLRLSRVLPRPYQHDAEKAGAAGFGECEKKPLQFSESPSNCSSASSSTGSTDSTMTAPATPGVAGVLAVMTKEIHDLRSAVQHLRVQNGEVPADDLPPPHYTPA